MHVIRVNMNDKMLPIIMVAIVQTLSQIQR